MKSDTLTQAQARLDSSSNCQAWCFTLSLVFTMADCVDPGGVIIPDAPNHTQTVRLHRKQVARDLTPEPEPIYTYIHTYKFTSTIMPCQASYLGKQIKLTFMQINSARRHCSDVNVQQATY